MKIDHLSNLNLNQAQSKVENKGGAQKIQQTFSDALNSLSQSENQSNQLIESLAAGENVDIHNVMIAVTETDINFKIAMAIRDKLVEAYRDISRMQV